MLPPVDSVDVRSEEDFEEADGAQRQATHVAVQNVYEVVAEVDCVR